MSPCDRRGAGNDSYSTLKVARNLHDQYERARYELSITPQTIERRQGLKFFKKESTMRNHKIEVDLPAGTRLRLGVPAEQPDLAIAALVKLFAGMDNVVRAKLGLMERVSSEGVGDFSYTIGLDCLGNDKHARDEALRVLQGVPSGRWPISIVPSDFLTAEAIVFYERGVGAAGSSTNSKKGIGWMRRMFGVRT